jgi:hypothetical protein
MADDPRHLPVAKAQFCVAIRAKRQSFRTQSPYPDVGVAQHPHIARVVWDDERD